MRDGRWLRLGISLLLLIFLVYQTYSVLYKPITTATATSYETYDGVEITGYFVREETVIDHKVKGTERYVVSEGEKVAKGGTVAEIYPSASVATAYQRVDELTEQIATLEAINSVSDPASVDLDTLNNRINRAYIDLISATDMGAYSNLSHYFNELLALMNKKQMLTGEVTSFDTILSSLKAELSGLKAGLVSATDKVTASSSGFFVPQTDGLEEILTPEEIEDIDESIFDKISSAKAKSGFGKIVSNHNWYIVAEMKNDEYLSFSENTTLTLKTSIEGCEELKATVKKIKITQNKNKAIIVLLCNTMNGQMAMTRSAPMTIVTKKYSGIRISNKAVRFVEGQTGVYIVQGSIVKFRPIEVVYTNDTYTLCKISDGMSSDMIRLYDEVIEKGKNLYDGKYIG